MSFKERFERLTSVSKPDQEQKERSQIFRELRERLDRLVERGRAYPKRERLPVEQLVEGEVVSTPYGEGFRVKEQFPYDYRYGEMTLSEMLAIPTYPAHLLSRDDRFKNLDLRKTLFLDTETTGLAGGTGTFVFMIGLGFFNEDGFLIQQLFMRDYSEEKACLSILNPLLDSFDFLVTFNGKHYDIPLLETRFILSRMSSRVREMPNFDLLFPSRKIWKGAYENCRLVTLESRLLGMGRDNDIPSEWIPRFYFDYVQTGDAREIQRVFYHNRMDILSMLALMGRIHLIYHDPHAAKPRKGVEHLSLGRLFWDHGLREKAIPCFEIALQRSDDDLTWEAMRWLSLALKKTGQSERARSLWEEMATWPYPMGAFPWVELAKYHEHRSRDFAKAIAYVDQALERTPPSRQKERESLLQRKQRLEEKFRRL